nr:large ribosomal subunit protein eL14-like [Dasypus novemcinctus]
MAFVSFGPHAGKLVAILDATGQKRALADGPCTQVGRQGTPFKCTQLSDSVLQFPASAFQKSAQQAWQKADLSTQWAATGWAKKIGARERKAKMAAFDCFKVTKAKEMKNRKIVQEVKRLQRAALLESFSPQKNTAAAEVPAKETATVGKRTSESSCQQAASQKAGAPKTQRGQKAPAQKAPAPQTRHRRGCYKSSKGSFQHTARRQVSVHRQATAMSLELSQGAIALSLGAIALSLGAIALSQGAFMLC